VTTGIVPGVVEDDDGQGFVVVAGRRADPGDHHFVLALLPIDVGA
jgi:hypothetical protein